MFDPVTAAIGVGGSVLSGALGLFGASQEADAAREAGEMQADAARQAAELQQKQYQQTRADLAPWRQTGQNALAGLGDVGLGGEFDQSNKYNPYSQFQQAQGLPQFRQFGISPEAAYQQQTQPFNFDPASDPGYQFRLKQGTEALEGSAAARGGLFSGQTGKDLQQYGQDLASQEYQNAFARDLAIKQNLGQAYGSAFGQNIAGQQAGFNQDLTGRQYGSQEFYNALNAENVQKRNAYNRLMGVSGMGQASAAQTAQAGQHAAQLQGQYGMQGAQAQAQAGQKEAGAWSNALGNIGNLGMGMAGTALNYNMFNRMYPQGGTA